MQPSGPMILTAQRIVEVSEEQGNEDDEENGNLEKKRKRGVSRVISETTHRETESSKHFLEVGPGKQAHQDQ